MTSPGTVMRRVVEVRLAHQRHDRGDRAAEIVLCCGHELRRAPAGRLPRKRAACPECTEGRIARAPEWWGRFVE